MPSSTPTLRMLVAAIPEECYERPVWKGLLYFVRDLGLYGASVAALLCTDHVAVLAGLWPLAGLAISGLFVLGHDAAHGAVFRQEWLNRLVARVCLLPSLHAYAVWVLGHNRIHHVHTGCDAIDFVWNPTSPQSYAALSRLGKLRHRLEWSAWGAGLYYVRALWWQRMMRLTPPQRFRRAFTRDRALVWGYLGLTAALLTWLGIVHYGSLRGGAWMWLKVFGVPWLCWNYFIAATVYVHHIAPQSAWRRRPDWTPFRGQVGATTNFLVPAWYNVFAHNIYLHVPHHVDPSVPFYHLPRAAAALAHQYGVGVATQRLRLRDYLATTRRCKLYDFERGVWCGYDAVGLRAPAVDCAVPGSTTP
jgi:omega-6 fatty acid desaturase (delta-12 desaturase)